jgi:hypothetical protein
MAATQAYDNMGALANGWERIYRTAVCSGIRGDRRHEARGGYHIGRAFQSARNYSVIRPEDRRGNGPNDAAAAIDMTMGRKDMILCTQRLRAVYANPRDPRRKFLNAFNGWIGRGSATRYDIYARRTSKATKDHCWHCHLELRRKFVLSALAVRAILSVLRGESVATWLRSNGITADPGPKASVKKPAPKAGVKAPPYPGRVLKRNDRQTRPDPAVKQWQQRMIDRGWKSIGRADGLPRKRFDHVVRRWQHTLKMREDGEVGPKTWPTPWTRPLGG